MCRAARSPVVTANNVDPRAHRTLGLLKRHGFSPWVEQYERVRSLDESTDPRPGRISAT